MLCFYPADTGTERGNIRPCSFVPFYGMHIQKLPFPWKSFLVAPLLSFMGRNVLPRIIKLEKLGQGSYLSIHYIYILSIYYIHSVYLSLTHLLYCCGKKSIGKKFSRTYLGKIGGAGVK